MRSGKLDLKKSRRELFTAKRDAFTEIDAPAVQYLMVDGHGDPNCVVTYGQAVQALFSTAYAIKFSCKANGEDFVVPPLEGLWSAPDPASFTARRKHEWDWTMMIMMPDHIDEQSFEAGAAKARGKLGELPSTLRLESLEEGLCLQALHVGSYDDEAQLLALLHDEIMPARGYSFAGPHHEVYLGDPRKVPAARLKTILRQPVRRPLAD